MRKILIISVLALFCAGVSAQNVMKKLPDGTYVVNTTTLAKDVNGYNGATPVEIHIKKDVITKVVPLANKETPGFFERVRQELFPKFAKTPIKKFSIKNVDAITGATYSSEAVKENVRLGVDYYKKHK